MNSNDERRYNRRNDDQHNSPRSDRYENRRQNRDRYRDQAEFASGHSESTDREDYSQSNDNWRERHDREYGKHGGDRPEYHQNENRDYGSPKRSHDVHQEYQNYRRGGYNNPNDMDTRNSDSGRRGTSGRSDGTPERGYYGNYPMDDSSAGDFRGAQRRFGTQTRDWGNDRGRFDRSRYDGSQYEADNNWQRRAGSGSYSSDSQGQGSYGSESGYTERQSHRGKGPKNYQRSDSRINDDINDALYDHHDIDASDIEVEVSGGTVILKGEVSSRNEKRGAETAIDNISGVQNVENRLHLKSHQSRGNSWSDSDKENASKTDQDSSTNSKSKNSKTSI